LPAGDDARLRGPWRSAFSPGDALSRFDSEPASHPLSGADPGDS